MAKSTIEIKVKVKYILKYVGKRFAVVIVRILIGHNYKSYKLIWQRNQNQ